MSLWDQAVRRARQVVTAVQRRQSGAAAREASRSARPATRRVSVPRPAGTSRREIAASIRDTGFTRIDGTTAPKPKKRKGKKGCRC